MYGKEKEALNKKQILIFYICVPVFFVSTQRELGIWCFVVLIYICVIINNIFLVLNLFYKKIIFKA